MVSLTPSESKSLIAKAVVQMPEVKNAMMKGLIFIRYGSGCAFVAEELLGIKIQNKNDYFTGLITGGELSMCMTPDKPRSFVIRDGRTVDLNTDPVQQMSPDDVLIKGANAVDVQGDVGVLVATEAGVGANAATAMSRGFHVIVPVGLEKLVPSVREAAEAMEGYYKLKYCTGMPVVLCPVPNAKVVTEIQAFEILCRANARHIASGGIDDSQGSVVLYLTGTEEEMEAACHLVKSIKGEPPVTKPGKLSPATKEFDFDVTYYHESVWPSINPKLDRYPWGKQFSSR